MHNIYWSHDFSLALDTHFLRCSFFGTVHALLLTPHWSAQFPGARLLFWCQSLLTHRMGSWRSVTCAYSSFINSMHYIHLCVTLAPLYCTPHQRGCEMFFTSLHTKKKKPRSNAQSVFMYFPSVISGVSGHSERLNLDALETSRAVCGVGSGRVQPAAAPLSACALSVFPLHTLSVRLRDKNHIQAQSTW